MVILNSRLGLGSFATTDSGEVLLHVALESGDTIKSHGIRRVKLTSHIVVRVDLVCHVHRIVSQDTVPLESIYSDTPIDSLAEWLRYYLHGGAAW